MILTKTTTEILKPNKETEFLIDAIMSADQVYINGVEDFNLAGAGDLVDLIHRMIRGMQVKVKMSEQFKIRTVRVSTLNW